jgi:hypothetical protein
MSAATTLAIEIVQHQLSLALPDCHCTVKFINPALQIHTDLPSPQPQEIRSILQTLRGCRYDFSNLTVETITIYGMRGGSIILWKKSFSLKQMVDDSPDRHNANPFSFDNQNINRFALPIAFLLNGAIHWSGLDFLLIGMKIWIHEFGHATVAWFSGRGATPLPFGWTNVNLNRSPIVYICFFLLWAMLFYTGWKEKKRLSMGIAVVAVIMQFGMTWFMSQDTFEMWFAFGGVGGEFYLSTLLILAFYIPLPDKWRWDFWRYPALLMGTHSFLSNFGFWHQVQRGTASIPWGTMLNGSGDAGGDMNQLRDWGWSDGQIINTYIAIGQVCFWLMLGIYFMRSVNLRKRGVKP